jgi:hypothetical protein
VAAGGGYDWLVLWIFVFLGFAALMYYITTRPGARIRTGAELSPESRYVVAFDERAVKLATPQGDEVAVAWSQLTRVKIRTTDEGPFLPDVFWNLYAGEDTPALVFPGGATGQGELLAEMQRRLPGFDNEQVIVAMGSAENAVFVVWTRSG